MSTTLPTDGAEGAVATGRARLSSCAFPGCGKPLDGRKSKYCSPRHKFADWDRLHPRLPLESYLAPRPLPTSPEGRRDVGKAKAAANNRWQLARAQELALEYLSTHPVAIISDVRQFAADKGIELEWWKPWTASVFLPPKKNAGWFEATGVRRKTHHTGGNARKVNEYRLTVEGRRALEEMRSK